MVNEGEQRIEVGAVLGWHHDETAARQQRHGELPHRDVEAQRGELPDRTARADAETFLCSGDKTRDAGVAHDDALRPACRTGGIDDIRGASEVVCTELRIAVGAGVVP